MSSTTTEFVAPHGSLGAQDRVRLAAFAIVVVPGTSQGGGPPPAPTPATLERRHSLDRRDLPGRPGAVARRDASPGR